MIRRAAAWVVSGCVLLGSAAIATEAGPIDLPTGKTITPTAATGATVQELDPRLPGASAIRANRAATEAASPDGALLAVLTTGANVHWGPDGKEIPQESTEWLFIFDISAGAPRQLQALPIPNSFLGLSWSHASDRLVVSGGGDDAVYEFARDGKALHLAATFKLGHASVVGPSANPSGINWPLTPVAGALSVSPDDHSLLVTNFENDSVSLIDLRKNQLEAEQDLRPGLSNPKLHGRPGGSYPRAVLWLTRHRAYVASERDREIIALRIDGARIRIEQRIPLKGQPIAMIANHSGTRLYTALDDTDQLAIIDTQTNKLIEALNVAAPRSIYDNAHWLGGVSPNALALTSGESTLLVSNGGENAIAVIKLSPRARDLRSSEKRNRDDDEEAPPSSVIGLVPTGWYPTGIATSKDETYWYVIDAKSPTGPNVAWCQELKPQGTCVTLNPLGFPSADNGGSNLEIHNAINDQLEAAQILSFPAPSPSELARLTKQVAHNNHFDHPELDQRDASLFTFLRQHIHHVIYVIKENRTYDQILGDLPRGNGDPRLTIFPEAITPNHHSVARHFVTLDNFLVSGEGSWTGWDWSTAARTNDFRERQDVAWWHRELMGSMWGANRHLNMGLPTNEERHQERPGSPSDLDILPGARDVGALDGPGGEEGRGYIWDAAFRAHLTVRNYGFYGLIDWTPPLTHDPFAQKTRMFFPTIPTLIPFTDIYYRGWDPAYPDFWRYQEWKREYDAFAASKQAPSLTLIELGNDHLGSYRRAIDGVNTPETQMADNDYALGLITETVANGPFAKDTLIIALEDDTCDGPDHVDAFRSVALLAGPYVRQQAVLSTRYTTVSVVKTIEEILGIGPIGLNDALAAPMSDLFDPSVTTWSYQAIVPNILRSTQLPLPLGGRASIAQPKHSAAYWAKAMAGQDFSAVDRVDPTTFNRTLWRGLKGDAPYPLERSKAPSSE
jgi:DNA-binding beta-propeller fold protein YncE